MPGLSLVGTVFGPNNTYTANISDLALHKTSQGLFLVAANHRGGGLSSFDVGMPDTLARFVSHAPYGTTLGWLAEPKITLLGANDGFQAYAMGLTYAAARGTLFNAGGSATRTVTSGLAHDTITATAMDIGGTGYVLASRAGGATFQSYRRGADGALTPLSTSLLPVGTRPDARINDIEVATVGGERFAIVTSTLGNFIACHKIDTAGRIQTGQVIGLSWQAPFMTPREVEVAVVGGTTFVIVAGAESSSLTVMRLDSTGRLTPVDHILDELGTRFNNVTELETVTLNGRSFVFVTGADDGISMFTLLPDGRLMHVGTVADTAGTALANVSGLAAGVISGKIAVFAASGTERGITQFTVDTGVIGATGYASSGYAVGTAADDLLVAQAGTVRITGGDGDDTLVAASRPVMLTGGKGADVFMPAAVVGTITITDFDPRYDRLDLSNLGMIRSPMQMSMTVTTTGLMIRFGATIIDVRSASGGSLSAGIVRSDNFPIAHYPTPGNNVTLVGTATGDWVNAGVNAATIYGLGGNDTLMGGIFDDRLYGESGNDTLLGQDGNDLLLGGLGNDRLQGGSGNDTLYGDDGSDLMISDDGSDVMQGSAGDDTLQGGTDNDKLYGEAGNDWLDGGDGSDSLSGGADMDTLIGGTGNDYLSGDAGADYLLAVMAMTC